MSALEKAFEEISKYELKSSDTQQYLGLILTIHVKMILENLEIDLRNECEAERATRKDLEY